MRNLLIICLIFLSGIAHAGMVYNPLSDEMDNTGDGTVSSLEWDNDGTNITSSSSFSNVGIGTIAPAFTLDVNGSINANSIKVAGTDVCLYGTDCGYVSAGGWTDGGANVYVTSTGDNVGIGTFNPLTKLHVKGDITVDGSTSGFILANSMKVDGDTTNKFTISQTGGTNNENVRLDLETTADTLVLDSTSGVTSVSAPTLNFKTGGLRSATSLSVGAAYDTEQTPASNGALIQGNVGIGTTSAGSYLLKVNGSVYATQYDTIPANNPQTQYSPILSGDTHYIIGMNSNGDNSNDDRLFISEGTDITTAHRLTLMPGGNIGIGTDSPISTLQVNGAVTATSFVGDGSGLTGLPSGGGWVDGGTNIYASPTTDNVGIGTTTPTAVLLVENAGTQDSFRVNDLVADATPFVVNAGGNVGIGTSNPTALFLVQTTGGSSNRFEVATGSAPSVTMRADAATSGDLLNIQGLALTTGNGIDVSSSSASQTVPLVSMAQSGASSGGTLRVNQSSATSTGRAVHITNAGTFDSFLVEDVATDSTPFVIRSDGNVGIGTTGPTQALHVVGTVSATAFVGDGSSLTGVGGWTDAGAFVSATTSTDNFGIGTSAPFNKFQIRGSVASNLSAHVINTNASGVASFISENDTGKSAQLVCTGGSYAVPNLCGMIVTTGDNFTIAEADGTQNLTVTGTGNVGIGSTAPNSVLNIPALKSTTGTRYLCIGSTGIVTSSASACSGT